MGDLIEVKKKIILLGDGAVGKTSLIRKFVVDKFDDDYLITVGFKITIKDLQITMDGKVHYLKLQIWDVLGQKGYLKLHKSSFPGTAGIIFVADITRKDTLQSLEDYWIPEAQNIMGAAPFIILANKSDLTEEAELTKKELGEFASKYKMPFYLTSAKNGENVKNAFYTLGERIIMPDSAKIKKPPKRKVIESEKSEIVGLIDRIIDDFCEVYGRSEDAMPVVRKQFELAGLDLTNPTEEAIRKAIDRLAYVEKGFKEKDVAEANRLKRLKWVKETL